MKYAICAGISDIIICQSPEMQAYAAYCWQISRLQFTTDELKMLREKRPFVQCDLVNTFFLYILCDRFILNNIIGDNAFLNMLNF